MMIAQQKWPIITMNRAGEDDYFAVLNEWGKSSVVRVPNKCPQWMGEFILRASIIISSTA